MAVINRKKFVKDIKKRISTEKAKRIKIILLILAAASLVNVFIVNNIILKIIPLWFIGMLILLFYMFHFIKSIEKIAMIKHVDVEELTEGEWINKEIYADIEKGKAKIGKKTDKKTKKEYICGPKDLGISKEQIEKLISLKKQGKLVEIIEKIKNKKKIKKTVPMKIEIKVGIPFVPSFLIAYLVSYLIVIFSLNICFGS